LQPRKAMFLLNSRIPRVSPVLARQSQWFSRGCPSVLPISLTGPAICTGLRTRESCCGWYDREGVLYQAAALPLPRTVRSAPRRQAPAARAQPEARGRPCPREAGRSRPPHCRVSPHLLRERTNPTRCTVPETTTSKICAGDASTRGCPRASPPSPRPPTAQHVSPRALPSIFARRGFGRYVATRFLAAADLHGHRPAVPTRARASCPRPAA